jgi:putative lipoprotein
VKYRIRVLAALLLFTTPAIAQSSAEPEQTAHTVTGTVSYRQRIALPPDAVVRLVIEDVSTPGAAKSIAEEQVSTNGKQVPISFDVKYDPAALNPAHRYQIRATISSAGKLLFTSATGYPVLTQGAPEKQVDIVVQQAQSEEPGGRTATPLTGTHWSLTQLNGQAVGPQNGHNEAWIELYTGTDRLVGSGGCNRLMGSYQLEGSSLRFRQVASTMMACPGDAMPREQAFVKALSATASFRIRGGILVLRGEDNTILARLTAEASKEAAP